MINIAIDGHVGSGKSTLARGLAKKLGFNVFDTGAIYRGLACEFKEKGYKSFDENIISDFISSVEVKIFFEDDVQHVVVTGHDHTQILRREEISMLSAQISPFSVLRDKVKDLQRHFAKEHNCIMEGRDIGTVVLPNADVKFFITASEEVRAQRRFDQVKDKPNSPSYQEILNDLRERDYKDEHRTIAPLKPAKDAIILDTSNMTLDDTINKCIEIINNKLN